MKVYLVDFENVKSKGLSGVDSLTENDSVIIFYSENSDTISFEMHQKVLLSKAEIEYLKVNVGGKNALDFQLSTLLGYLVAKNVYSHIFVISNDRGFDFLHDFWHGKYVASPSCTVYRTRTITSAINYAKTNRSEPVDTATETEDTAEIHIESAEDSTEAVTEIIKIDVQDVCEQSADITEEQQQIYSDVSETVTESAEEKSAAKESAVSACEKSKCSPTGFDETLKAALFGIKFSDEDITVISQMLVSSSTKEEFHNLLAKNFKAEATEIYKLLRPKYLKLKALFAQETPDTALDKSDKPAGNEFIAADVISVRLAELLADKCSDEEITKIRELFIAAQTKQQLYIRMVKEFRKEKGCDIYNAIRSEYTTLRKPSEEIGVAE